MEEELQRHIQRWVNSNGYLGKNSIVEIDTNFKEGEFIFRLEKSVDLNVIGISKKVRVSRNFPTFAQNDQDLNSKGDVERFEQLVEVIEKDFINSISNAIDEVLPQD
jgi:hypothetical protein